MLKDDKDKLLNDIFSTVTDSSQRLPTASQDVLDDIRETILACVAEERRKQQEELDVKYRQQHVDASREKVRLQEHARLLSTRLEEAQRESQRAWKQEQFDAFQQLSTVKSRENVSIRDRTVFRKILHRMCGITAISPSLSAPVSTSPASWSRTHSIGLSNTPLSETEASLIRARLLNQDVFMPKNKATSVYHDYVATQSQEMTRMKYGYNNGVAASTTTATSTTTTTSSIRPPSISWQHHNVDKPGPRRSIVGLRTLIPKVVSVIK